jgi:hypothetical protein
MRPRGPSRTSSQPSVRQAAQTRRRGKKCSPQDGQRLPSRRGGSDGSSGMVKYPSSIGMRARVRSSQYPPATPGGGHMGQVGDASNFYIDRAVEGIDTRGRPTQFALAAHLGAVSRRQPASGPPPAAATATSGDPAT